MLKRIPWEAPIARTRAVTPKGGGLRETDLPCRDRIKVGLRDRTWFCRQALLTLVHAVAFEVVSPIFRTCEDWETPILRFWQARRKVFHNPKDHPSCGSHIHVAPSTKRWTLPQLRNICAGIVHFEPWIDMMLPSSRRNNSYCQRNTLNTNLYTVCKPLITKGWFDAGIFEMLDWTMIIPFMQHNRNVLWNFKHVHAAGRGSIEFRGGKCQFGIRGTRAWIAFGIGYLHLLQGLVRRDPSEAARSRI